MGWIPDSIDALTRMYQQTGGFGFIILGVVVAVFILAVGVVWTLTRHTGQLVDLGKVWLSTTELSSKAIVTELTLIKESNDVIAERVKKLPSDKIECKAHAMDEIKRAMGEALAANGLVLEDRLLARLAERHVGKEAAG